MHGQLAREFTQLAEHLRDRTGPQELLDTIIRLAVPAVGCRHVGLLLCVRGRTLRLGQATDAEAAEAGQVQIAVRQGPCWSGLACPDGPGEILVDDTTDDARWPAWNWPVTELGVRSVLSARLTTDDGPVGFLSWYDTAPHGFTPDVVTVAHVVALHAAEPLSRVLEQLPRTVARRPLQGHRSVVG
ncbi:GAF domain-containing protein [Kribbella sp. WER1]